MLPELKAAMELFKPHLPANSVLTIEINSCTFGPRYLYRLQYNSTNSGRTMCVLAKGDTLPKEEDSTFLFYLRQIVLTPKEVSIEFARLYWRERNARQQLFLSNQFGNIRVSDKTASKDKPVRYGDLVA